MAKRVMIALPVIERLDVVEYFVAGLVDRLEPLVMRNVGEVEARS